MKILKSKILNISELARQLGISRSSFHNKMNKVNYNKFSVEEIEKLKKIIEEFIVEFKSET
jgi:DNA-binding NtrC family response regulator